MCKKRTHVPPNRTSANLNVLRLQQDGVEMTSAAIASVSHLCRTKAHSHPSLNPDNNKRLHFVYRRGSPPTVVPPCQIMDHILARAGERKLSLSSFALAGGWVLRILRGGWRNPRERRSPRRRKTGKRPILLRDFSHRSCFLVYRFHGKLQQE